MTEESHVWKGRPSQITNLATFIICGLTFVLVVPLVIGLWRWLSVRCTEYRLSTERLTLSWGVLSRHVEELELYRVKDTGIDSRSSSGSSTLAMWCCGRQIARTPKSCSRPSPIVAA